MAFPTAVNEQVTDAVQNSAENTQASLPEKIIQMSSAFAQTLEMENTVFQNQLNGIVQMALDVALKTILLKKLAEEPGYVPEHIDPLKALDELKLQIAGKGEAAKSSATALPVLGTTETATNQNEENLEAIAVQTVGESYKNAVVAQQQMYITMQAATTQAIVNILGADTVTIPAPGTNHTLAN